jgi:hypothetical protein
MRPGIGSNLSETISCCLMFNLFEEIECSQLNRELGYSATRTHYWVLPGPEESLFLAYYVPFMTQISSVNLSRIHYLPRSDPKLYK